MLPSLDSIYSYMDLKLAGWWSAVSVPVQVHTSREVTWLFRPGITIHVVGCTLALSGRDTCA